MRRRNGEEGCSFFSPSLPSPRDAGGCRALDAFSIAWQSRLDRESLAALDEYETPSP